MKTIPQESPNVGDIQSMAGSCDSMTPPKVEDMFSFHKPRVYRSVEGCCICRAKSSSSRFSDSRKYESDALKCFALKYPRHGEICNACVLLVKRFKRLPVDSTRRWGHVVDARAGPGTKSQSKSKRYRESTEHSVRSATPASATSSHASVSASSNKRSASTMSAGHTSKSAITEKFTKIFKKNKNKALATSPPAAAKTDGVKRSKAGLTAAAAAPSANFGWNRNHSLSTTPESLDSDYEESRYGMASSGGAGPGGSGVVQFQTQTRASFRSRNNAAVAAINKAVANAAEAAAAAATAAAAAVAVAATTTVSCKRSLQLGSKRRRRLSPRKNRRGPHHEDTTASSFIDALEWREVKSCCGMVYECASLGGSLLIDMQHYKPCAENHHLNAAGPAAAKVGQIVSLTLSSSVAQTSPTMAAPPAGTAIVNAATRTESMTIGTTTTPATVSAPMSTTLPTSMPTPTPVLKKHHLFFKRQSEMFPQPDAATANGASLTTIKTETTVVAQTEATVSDQTEHSTITKAILPIKAMTTAPGASTSLNTFEGAPYGSVGGSGSVGVASIVARHSAATTKLATLTPIQLSNVASNNATLSSAGFHANNSVSTAATAAASTLSISNGIKSQGFLHKIKTHDIGKVVKQTEKSTSSVRLKPNDVNDMKQLVKSVDRNYVMAKPVPSLSQLNQQHHGAQMQQQQQHPITLTCATLTSAAGSSPSSATKFSDNSSDSGFDENMQERKSASPLQEDNERKMQSRPGVQTMFLASGVQIQGQQQNLVLTGNEVAAKILQNRKREAAVSIHQPHNHRINASSAGTTSIIAQIGGSGGGATHAKMRAIYNNNNMIQHENGVTTIVPASSLAATTQTAAMNALAPSTVTITPAPPPPSPQTDATQSSLMAAAVAASMMPRPSSLTARRLVAASGINTAQHLSTAANNGHLHHHMGSVVLGGAHLSAINGNVSVGAPTLTGAIGSATNTGQNQKIILLKAPAKYGASNQNSNSNVNISLHHTTTTAATTTGLSLSVSTAAGRQHQHQQSYQQQQRH